MEKGTENYSQYCIVVGATDVGKKRAANEDYLGKADTPNGRVAVVCDGMGGHVGGATASHIAVETILDFLRKNYRNDPREAIGEAVDAANNAILNHALAHPELQGMGSTCVLLLVREGKAYIGHVGDSRIYLVRSKTIRQLTKDHSFVQTLVDAGAITKEEAEHHPRKNEITNALGTPNMKPATVREEPISPEAGDVFLLCSDGLSNMVDDEHIAHIASNFEMTTQQRADALVQRANDKGGLDNITCVLVEFSAKPETAGNASLRKKKPFMVGMIIALLVICCIAAWLLSRWLTFHEEPQPSPSVDTLIVQSSENLVEKETITMDLGDIIVKDDEKKLITIDFNHFFTLIKVVNSNKEYNLDAEFDPKMFKCDESVIEVMSNEKKVELSLTKKTAELRTELEQRKKLKQPFRFILQNETTVYEFYFNVKAEKTTSKTNSLSPSVINSNPTNPPDDKPFCDTVPPIFVNKDDYRIVLCDKQSDDPADYWVIKRGYSFLTHGSDKGWYAIENDGYKCCIIIKRKSEIPFDAKIPIIVRSGVEGIVLLRIVPAGQ